MILKVAGVHTSASQSHGIHASFNRWEHWFYVDMALSTSHFRRGNQNTEGCDAFRCLPFASVSTVALLAVLLRMSQNTPRRGGKRSPQHRAALAEIGEALCRVCRQSALIWRRRWDLSTEAGGEWQPPCREATPRGTAAWVWVTFREGKLELERDKAHLCEAVLPRLAAVSWGPLAPSELAFWGAMVAVARDTLCDGYQFMQVVVHVGCYIDEHLSRQFRPRGTPPQAAAHGSAQHSPGCSGSRRRRMHAR